MTLSEQITYSTTLLKCELDTPDFVSVGTGFIMHLCVNNDRCIPVLITNKHVIANARSCSFALCKRNHDGTPNDTDVEWIKVDVPGNWIMHPNQDIDLCCLPIGHIINNLIVDNEPTVLYTALGTDIIPTQEEISHFSAMENIVMVGYPNGISDTHNNKPILRRGITATHMKHDYKNTKTFLIDAACFNGSSGSPVFILDEGAYLQQNTLIAGGRIKLVGVLYAGPQFKADGEIVFSHIPTIPRTTTEIPMNLGRVIKSSEILAFEPLLKILCAV